MLLLESREVLGRTGFVESNIPDFMFVLPLIYYMAFGASFAFSYWSFHLKIRLYILFSFTWVECQVGIKHRGETGTKYMLQRLIGEELIQEKLKDGGVMDKVTFYVTG